MGLSFAKGRSICPSCHTMLMPLDVIPVIAYVLQKGKCRYCKSNISSLYPLMELLTGLLFLFAYIRIGFTLELFSVLMLVSLLIIISVSDLYYMRIPDSILLWFLPMFIIIRIIQPLDPWYDPLAAAVTAYVLILLIILASNGGMGTGDMKLFALLGIMLGLKKILLTFFIATLIGSVAGILLLVTGKVKRKEPVPFAPFIAAGALTSYFYGNTLIDLYRSFFCLVSK